MVFKAPVFSFQQFQRLLHTLVHHIDGVIILVHIPKVASNKGFQLELDKGFGLPVLLLVELHAFLLPFVDELLHHLVVQIELPTEDGIINVFLCPLFPMGIYQLEMHFQ